MHRFTVILLALALVSCGHRRPEASARAMAFADVISLPTTPVKDQGRSSLCWACAMLATIETERIVQGDSVNLSVLFPVRSFLEEQASTRLIARSRQPITTRGMGGMLLHLIERYGLTHYDAYHLRPDAPSLATVTRKIEAMSAGTSSVDAMRRLMDQTLDDAFGQPTPTVHFLGAEYSPVEFAHSVCLPDDYVAMTSFTHHPFGVSFALEVADNYYHDAFLNVPLDSLMGRIEGALRSGHPVCWEGDVSEPGFDAAAGVATLPDGAATSQRARQTAFESGQTSDDHCMELVGIARDSRGHTFFKAKNSWGNVGPYHGFIYLSRDYVAMKTIAVWIPRSAIR